MTLHTWHQMMTSGGIDSYENYMGDHDHADHYVVASRNRDSDHLTNSNFESFIDMLGGESETVYTLQFNHWAVGWVEHLFINPSDTEKCKLAEEILDQLSDYPVLDEEDFSKREWEAWCEWYDTQLQSDLERIIEEREIEAETNFFLNEEDEIELDEDELELLFEIASDNASGYSYEHCDLGNVADTFITVSVRAKLPKHPDLFEQNDTPIMTEEIRDGLERLLNTVLC